MADAIRHPSLAPDRDVRPWQDVMVELASRLRFPAFTNPDGTRKFRDYPDFIVSATSARRASASSPAGAARTAKSR